MRRAIYIPAILIGGAFIVAPNVSADAQNAARPPFSARPEMKLEVKGAQVKQLSGELAGRPLSVLPGARTITYDELSNMKDIPKTGLFLVEMDYVPQGLSAMLKKEGLRLKADGSLVDRRGQPVTIIHKEETFSVQREKKTEREPLRFGSVESPDSPMWRKIRGAFVGEAQAASPHPFSCFSWSWSWRYNGGFCRDYRAWTNTDAWGPDAGGACGPVKPHTRIASIETRAEIGGHKDRDTCVNCDSEGSDATWDIGCFWPAHGGATGFHFVNLVDGGINIIRSHSW